MSKIANKIATLQASLANTASTYFLTQQTILNAEYSVTVVEDGEFQSFDEGENLDVLVSRMASGLRWMNQCETMLANLLSDYYRDLSLEIVRGAKAAQPAPIQAVQPKRSRAAAKPQAQAA